MTTIYVVRYSDWWLDKEIGSYQNRLDAARHVRRAVEACLKEEVTWHGSEGLKVEIRGTKRSILYNDQWISSAWVEEVAIKADELEKAIYKKAEESINEQELPKDDGDSPGIGNKPKD